jgi:small subunit ribosomal protein S20
LPPRTPPKKSLSVIKRARQAEKLQMRNKAVRSKLRTLSRKVTEAVGANDRERVELALNEAVKAIDSAASKGVIHRNTASRKISRLTRLSNAVLRAEAA